MTAKRGASQIYLTEQEYLQVSVDWIVKDVEAWRWLAKKWSTPEWIATSKLHRENRGTGGPGHRYGADGHYNLARRMEHQDGVAPSFMDVYIRGHRGSDPTNPEALCTEAAKEKMMAYGEEMTQHHGPDVDWRHAEVDPEALHASGGGRRHGRYAFGTGVVDYNPSVSQARRSGSGGGCCSTRGGSSGNTNGRAADKHDSLHGFLPSGHHGSIGTGCELATLLPSSNVSAKGGCHHPRARNHLRGGRWYPRPPYHLWDGRWYHRAPRHLRGGRHRRALSHLRGGWHRRALRARLRGGWHRRALIHLELDGTSGLPPPSGWMTAATPHFNPWMQSPHQHYGSQGSASRPSGPTPEAEGNDDLAGSGGASRYNSQSPGE
ncbi:hypothetical protein U9M48_016136 [Paspalum notatum var. saurae]|uniref:Uncharacterized protein n=1 Tax=Paspalum notatum var. saurae TaxID=547442 RepID=A0AAQ3T4V2_PASNO